MLVDMGVDRIHHAFWKPMDPRHPQYEPDSPFVNAIHDYYVHVDQRIGGTATAVRRRHCRPGSLRPWGTTADGRHLHQRVADPERIPDPEAIPDRSSPPLDKVEVDWSQTKVWGGWRLLCSHLP